MSEEIKKFLEAGEKNIILIYALYLLGSITMVLPLVGVIFAFIHMEHKNPIWRSHYLFAFRTFMLSIAGFIVSLIISLLFMSMSIFFVSILLYISIFVWFIVRSIIAIRHLLNGEAHPNPMTFGIK